MKENALNKLTEIPDEIFENHLLGYLSEKDLSFLGSASQKSRDLVITHVFQNKTQSSENLFNQYLSFWLSNLHFIFENKNHYQIFLERSLREKPLKNLQKISVYSLLKTLYREDPLFKDYYSCLLSLLEMRYDALIDCIEKMVNIQLTPHLLRSSEEAKEFKKFFFDNINPIKDKRFLVNILKYWDNPLALTTLDELKSYTLEHISHSDVIKQETAVRVLGFLSPILPCELRNEFIDSLLTHSLFNKEVWVRKKALDALYSLTKGLLEEQLISPIEKIIRGIADSAVSYWRKEYAVQFLDNPALPFSTDNIKTLIELLIPQARQKTEFNYGMRKASIKVLIQFLGNMSDEQLFRITSGFYELLTDTGMPDSIIKLAERGLKAIAKTSSLEKGRRLVKNFSEKIVSNNLLYILSKIQVLAHLSPYLYDDELRTSMESIFVYLTEENEYINEKAYAALEVILDNLADTQIELVHNILLKKMDDHDLRISESGIKAITLFSERIPSDSIEHLMTELLPKMESTDSLVCEAAICTLRALAMHKKIISSDWVIPRLLQQIPSADPYICEAAIKALTVFIPLMGKEEIRVQFIPLLFSHIKNKDKGIRAAALNALSQLVNFVPPESFTTHIREGVLLESMNDKKETSSAYEATLFLIQKFEKHLSPSDQKELVKMLIKHILDEENYSDFFQPLSDTLSHFFNKISPEQQTLLKAATFFKSDASLTHSERKPLHKKIHHATHFWEQFYTHQVRQNAQVKTNPHQGMIISSSFFSPVREKAKILMAPSGEYAPSQLTRV